jgi:hypothetical protein
MFSTATGCVACEATCRIQKHAPSQTRYYKGKRIQSRQQIGLQATYRSDCRFLRLILSCNGAVGRLVTILWFTTTSWRLPQIIVIAGEPTMASTLRMLTVVQATTINQQSLKNIHGVD